ncbi:preprotein translocase subunit YajC [Treponema pectinovorum]|uniref:preprotein translocase subunit YajC n=1 Tax=Treponema pectinovorum TaxID=164 RepID=UPI003D8B952C
MSFVPLLMAAPQAGQPQNQNILMSILPFALIIAIFYFFIIRPQNKKQKETEKMLSAIKKGDKVVTIGGIHGVVNSTKEKTVVVKVDTDTTLEFNRSAIATVISDKVAEKPAKKSKKDEKKVEEVSKAEDSAKTEEKPAENSTTDVESESK